MQQLLLIISGYDLSEILLVVSQVTFAVSWSGVLGLEGIPRFATIISLFFTLFLWVCYTVLKGKHD